MLLLVAPDNLTLHRTLSMAAGLALLLTGLAGCSNDLKRSERFPNIHQPNFKIDNPSRDHASATGIGCGGTKKGALLEARNTATFNLRNVTGNGNYKIRFDLLQEMPKRSKICVEVKATAVDAA